MFFLLFCVAFACIFAQTNPPTRQKCPSYAQVSSCAEQSRNFCEKLWQWSGSGAFCRWQNNQCRTGGVPCDVPKCPTCHRLDSGYSCEEKLITNCTSYCGRVLGVYQVCGVGTEHGRPACKASGPICVF